MPEPSAAEVPATDDSGRECTCNPIADAEYRHALREERERLTPARPGAADELREEIRERLGRYWEGDVPDWAVDEIAALPRVRRLLAVEREVRKLAESARRTRSVGDRNGSMTPAGFVRVDELLRALGGDDDD